ncbi:hypothetical protein AMATHDRAFT_164698, partial [Amanita thiersii Skay4041]
VFFEGLCEDEDIIHVYTHPSLSDLVPKNVVHHGLEHRWRIFCPESHLPFITFLDPYVVVTPANIHLREVFGVG